MANETFTANQTTVATPGFDADGDGVIDPGEIVTTTVTITNNSTTDGGRRHRRPVHRDAHGMTIVDQPGDDINVSPIAFDDAYNVVGNTTFVVNAANGMLNGSTATHVTLGADAEFFTNTIGANAATQTHIVTTGVVDTAGGSVTLNADGSFTYTPDAGFTGTDSFTYTLTDAGLDGNFATAGDNLTGTGTVTFNVEDTVWFIDNTHRAASTSAPRTIRSPRSRRSMPSTTASATTPPRATSSTCGPALIPKPTASTCSTTRP